MTLFINVFRLRTTSMMERPPASSCGHSGFWTRHEYWQALNALAARIDSSTEASPSPVPAEGERLDTSTPLSAGMELYRLPGSGE